MVGAPHEWPISKLWAVRREFTWPICFYRAIELIILENSSHEKFRCCTQFAVSLADPYAYKTRQSAIMERCAIHTPKGYQFHALAGTLAIQYRSCGIVLAFGRVQSGIVSYCVGALMFQPVVCCGIGACWPARACACENVEKWLRRKFHHNSAEASKIIISGLKSIKESTLSPENIRFHLFQSFAFEKRLCHKRKSQNLHATPLKIQNFVYVDKRFSHAKRKDIGNFLFSCDSFESFDDFEPLIMILEASAELWWNFLREALFDVFALELKRHGSTQQDTIHDWT